jgi:hypothetical protein
MNKLAVLYGLSLPCLCPHVDFSGLLTKSSPLSKIKVRLVEPRLDVNFPRKLIRKSAVFKVAAEAVSASFLIAYRPDQEIGCESELV